MNNEKIEANPILKLSIEFSLSIISYCQKLEDEKKYVIARQLLRSGTSIGANAFEAQNNESTADFIHKFKIAAKEVCETQYWLILCKNSMNNPECDELLAKLDSIDKIVSKIISTAKRKKPLSYFLSFFIL